ncbi:MAG TPA: 2-dehydropantoate 2-reductase [Candidatus Polarisedimenticolia bacterium]|nr:2-dehydropantoate 2-reductase [Candidatus Polarisedimenticolia bacterium]
MKVAVFGAGAVGGYLGSRLAAARADVHLIARGAHLAALRENGLTLITPDGVSTSSVWATDDPATIGLVDLVLFCVKSYDTETAAAKLAPMIGPATMVLSLQNGIDNEPKIAAAIGEGHVLGGAAYILAAIESPGVVRSGAARIVIGELRPGPASDRVLALVELARSGGVDASASSDVRVAKWEKYTLLVAFSAVSAGTQLPLGDIRRSAAAVEMLRAVMHEAWQVGRALGVPLADDLVERQSALVLKQNDNEGTSLRHDLLTGHRMEVDALQGTLKRLGRETGIPTPWTDAAFAILDPWATRNADLTSH